MTTPAPLHARLRGYGREPATGGSRRSSRATLRERRRTGLQARRATTPYRDGFNVTDTAFFSGTFDPVAMAAAAPATYRPNATFNLADQYQLVARCGCRPASGSRRVRGINR